MPTFFLFVCLFCRIEERHRCGVCVCVCGAVTTPHHVCCGGALLLLSLCYNPLNHFLPHFPLSPKRTPIPSRPEPPHRTWRIFLCVDFLSFYFRSILHFLFFSFFLRPTRLSRATQSSKKKLLPHATPTSPQSRLLRGGAVRLRVRVFVCCFFVLFVCFSFYEGVLFVFVFFFLSCSESGCVCRNWRDAHRLSETRGRHTHPTHTHTATYRVRGTMLRVGRGCVTHSSTAPTIVLGTRGCRCDRSEDGTFECVCVCAGCVCVCVCV